MFKWTYTMIHNFAAALLSLTSLVLSIVFVQGLNAVSMPEVPRAFERLRTFYLAECVRLIVYNGCTCI